VQGAERLRHPFAEISFALGEEGEAGKILLKVSDIAAIKEPRLQGGKGGDGLLQAEVVNLRGFGIREGGAEAGLDFSRLRLLGKDAESPGPGSPQRGGSGVELRDFHFFNRLIHSSGFFSDFYQSVGGMVVD
jgi:hypothetical protein